MRTIEDLKLRIGKVRARERRVALATGISKTALAMAASCLVFFLADYFLAMPIWGRAASAAMLACAVAAAVRKALVLPLRRIMDDDEIALRIERRHPELRGRLISTVQLAREGRAGGYLGSPELIAALEAETLEAAGPLDFFGIVDTSDLLHFGSAAMAVAVVAAASCLRWPEHASVLFRRLAMADVAYPTRTRILALEAPPLVARGDPILVRVRLDPSAYVPEDDVAGTLEARTADGGAITEDLVRDAGGDPAVFAARIGKATEDIVLSARVDDASAGGITVRVVPRPEITGGHMRIISPAYTMRPPETVGRIGDVTALIGSEVEIEAKASKPIRSARIVRADGTSIPMKVELDGTVLKLASPMKIDKDTNYHFELTDRDGLTNADPIEYIISAKPDAPPTVRILVPDRDLTRTPNARQPVRCAIKDDFGTRVAWIKWRIDDSRDVRELKLEIPPERVRDRELELNFEWMLKDLNLRPGQVVTYWIEADDFCDSNDFAEGARGETAGGAAAADGRERAYSRSRELKFFIVDQTTKWRELMDAVEQAAGRIRTIKEEQEKARDATGKAIDQIKD